MDLIECKKAGINRHPWELSRVENLINEVKKYYIGKTILDIGCGDSYLDYTLINEVKDIDKIYGIDIYAKEDINDDKYIVVNDYKKLNKKKFDTILMFDVFEHIDDDCDFMKNTVLPLLNTNGRIILTVPAYQFLFSKHDKELKHYRRYNVKMFKDICNNANLNILVHYYFYASLLPFRLITKLLNKDNKVNEWKYDENHILTKLIRGILNVDYKLCKKMNKLSFGLSLFIVLEKK